MLPIVDPHIVHFSQTGERTPNYVSSFLEYDFSPLTETISSIKRFASSAIVVASSLFRAHPRVIHSSDDKALKAALETLEVSEQRTNLTDLVVYGTAEALTQSVLEGGANLHRTIANQFVGFRSKLLVDLTGDPSEKAFTLLQCFRSYFLLVAQEDRELCYQRFYPELIL